MKVDVRHDNVKPTHTTLFAITEVNGWFTLWTRDGNVFSHYDLAHCLKRARALANKEVTWRLTPTRLEGKVTI